MIRTKTMEVRETDMETANELLKDPHWALITVVTDNNTQKVKYVLKRKGTYDDKELLLSNCTTGGTDIDKYEEPVIDLSGAVPQNNDDKNGQIRHIKNLSEEEQELIFVDKFISKLESIKTAHTEKIKHGIVTHRGLKIGKDFYKFGNEYDMWKYIGEKITVVGENAFDVFGSNLGKIDLI